MLVKHLPQALYIHNDSSDHFFICSMMALHVRTRIVSVFFFIPQPCAPRGANLRPSHMLCPFIDLVDILVALHLLKEKIDTFAATNGIVQVL